MADRLVQATRKTPRERGLHIGAGEEIRTLDIHLGKVALYQLSYSRVELIVMVVMLVLQLEA